MSTFPVNLGNGAEVLTFDIGGTSFRSGLLTCDGRLTAVKRLPSINHRSVPGASAADIIDQIAAYIAATVKAFAQSSGSARLPPVAISMGAALNAHTGKILGSGPILGDEAASFDLDWVIRQRLDDARITIINDVTASLIAHSRLPSMQHARRLALITVSTGIASRVLDCSIPHVPVDAVFGTQGEIGHHRVVFSLDGAPISLKCECGGMDHLSAFASGQGIRRVLERAGEMFPEKFPSLRQNNIDFSSDVSLNVLADGLASGDPVFKQLLDAITLPIAEAIKWHFMLDPEIDKLILTGGVCFSLRDFYLASVLENLISLDFYPLTSGKQAFWSERVILGPDSDDAGLIGAAYLAREAPMIHRRETLATEPPYRVSRHQSVDYPVHVVRDIFRNDSFPKYLLDPFDRIVLVTEANVDEGYGEAIRELFASTYRHVDKIVLRASERQKDLFAVTEVVSSFENLGVCRRKDLVVAAGGGITLDIVGFSTSIYKRGIPCLRLPTTLLAAIDAGIGVKTAVNFRQNKSRLGTFSAPYAVIVDPCFLSTLTDRQIRNGLAEALKIALVADAALFELIEEHGSYLVRTRLQSPQGIELIQRAIRAMLLELSPNLYERTLDRLPDYGHTFSPVFEFDLSDLEHGEAVALDMAISTGIAAVSGILDIGLAERILDAQHTLGLPIVRAGVNVEMLLRGVCDARRHRGGQLRMPVLRGIGKATFINEITPLLLEDALGFIRCWSSGRMSEVPKIA